MSINEPKITTNLMDVNNCWFPQPMYEPLTYTLPNTLFRGRALKDFTDTELEDERERRRLSKIAEESVRLFFKTVVNHVGNSTTGRDIEELALKGLEKVKNG